MQKKLTGAEIRQTFIDYFVEHNHTFVPSSSLVPGGDATLLFTNAGMVQFKEVFLGTDQRPYTRAANAQKCLRVAGKHNDLDDVGRDDTHHTFFEMLGNWSFGDYYKKEAITWSWDLLTRVWGLPPEKLWATVFRDEKGQIPQDDEAAQTWLSQPGFIKDHLLFSGRKDNFWEMAETGPCGPCTEINYDRGLDYCDKQDDPDHICVVNGDCKRFVEIWNNVFIQYNRLSADELAPLPKKHVDTGMGLERIVSVLQGVDSNYKTDLLSPILDKVQEITGHTEAERLANITPYRVIADHSRTAAFLIADGVNPGNIGRNYICRMIIRRASRFGMKINLDKPFLAQTAAVVIENYGDFYPELKKNRKTILDNITREEERFQKTVNAGMDQLQTLLDTLKNSQETVLDGHKAFDLYATLGLPFELTRDVAREQGLDVDEAGFTAAMEAHRLASGGGKAMGEMGGDDVDLFRTAFEHLQSEGKISASGVVYNPYDALEAKGSLLALFSNGQQVAAASIGQDVEVFLPETCFYVESGGQVSDAGVIQAEDGSWQIAVTDVRKPAAGVIVHLGRVLSGTPQVGDACVAQVDAARRTAIRRNHTATHLMHAVLHNVLGEHARQAGSLVTPERLRFDFSHPKPLTQQEILTIEAAVNNAVLQNLPVKTVTKTLQQAIDEGAMALFGEKYGSDVRTITIGDESTFSYELCGGTHVDQAGDIGLFLIEYEGSIASGVRRIEAVTGEGAYLLARRQMNIAQQVGRHWGVPLEEIPNKINTLEDELVETRKELEKLRSASVAGEFEAKLAKPEMVNDIPVLTCILKNADGDALRNSTDKFREKFASGVVVLASVLDDKPIIVAAVTDDLIKRGLHAGNLVKEVASVVGGGGGGRPNLAQAGGKDPSKLAEALDQVIPYIKKNLK